MMSAPLEHLLAAAADLVPEMNGSLIEEPIAAIHLAGDNHAAIQDMFHFWESHAPQAGRHYVALRCWGLLIWQPIYLSVIAVYHGNVQPLLSHMYLPVQRGLTNGYAILRHPPLTGTQDQRIRCACEQLNMFCAGLRQTLAGIVKLNMHSASCMQADCVLAALLVARAGDMTVSDLQMHERAQHWLSGCGLSGKSSYFEFAQKNQTAMALHRQTCCHHFRRENARHCNTCPKLSIGERIARLNGDGDIC